MISGRGTRCIAAAVLAAAMAATACSTADSGPPTRPAADAPTGGAMVIGIGRPASVDPADASDRDSYLLTSTLCDSLLAVDPRTGEIVPALAESWSIGNEGASIIVKLRKGLTFPDGRPLTSRDVAYSLSRAASADYAGRLADLLRPIDGWNEIRGRVDDAWQEDRERLRGVRTLTEQTVEIRLTLPNAEFLAVLTHPVAAPLSREAVEADPDGARIDPPCVGPYRLAEPFDQEASEIVLERRDDYYAQNAAWTGGGAGYLDEFVFRVLEDIDTEPTAPTPSEPVPSESGPSEPAPLETAPSVTAPEVAPPSFDGLDLVAVPAARWDETFSDGDIVTAPGPGVEYVGVPIPPLSGGDDETSSREDRAARQRAIREALSLAIDREAVAERVFHGGRLPATSFLPETFVSPTLDPTCGTVPTKAQPEAARAALKRAGGRLDADTLTFLYNDDFRNGALAKELARQWEQVLGLRVQPQAATFQEMLDALNQDAGQPHLFRTSWSVPYPSVDQYLYPQFSSTEFGLGNLSRYQNFAFDELMIEDVREAADTADRVLLLRDAIDVVCRDLPLIPVTTQRIGYLVRDRVAATGNQAVGGHLGLPLLRELYVTR